MKRRHLKKIVPVCLLLLGLVTSCLNYPYRHIEFRIEDGFEGAVVVKCGEPQSTPGKEDGETNTQVFEIPSTGIASFGWNCPKLSGVPSFTRIHDSANKIDYLYARDAIAEKGGKSFESITVDERQNKIFAMNFEQGSFNTKNGVVRFISFLICKPKDGNFYASTELPRKIAELHGGHARSVN